MLFNKLSISEYLIKEAFQTEKDSSVYEVARWVADYLCQPHPDLGRKGHICPFTARATQLNAIKVIEVKGKDLSADEVESVVTHYFEDFIRSCTPKDKNTIYQSSIIIFPDLVEKDFATIDAVQKKLQKMFVLKGMMLGEFHKHASGKGLRNKNFKPLISPFPILAIRLMVDTDLEFLKAEKYNSKDKIFNLSSYLKNLGSDISDTRFEEVINVMVNIPLEKA